jgi:hypothetical protein
MPKKKGKGTWCRGGDRIIDVERRKIVRCPLCTRRLLPAFADNEFRLPPHKDRAK